MEKAETYVELMAECPDCNESNIVEWQDESAQEYDTWVCDNCGAHFKFCHPANTYGL